MSFFESDNYYIYEYLHKMIGKESDISITKISGMLERPMVFKVAEYERSTDVYEVLELIGKGETMPVIATYRLTDNNKVNEDDHNKMTLVKITEVKG